MRFWLAIPSAIKEFLVNSCTSQRLPFENCSSEGAKMSKTGSQKSTSTAEVINSRGKLGLGEVTDPETRAWTLRVMFFSVANTKARPAIDELHARCQPAFEEMRRVSRKLLPGDKASFPPLVIKTVADRSESSRRHYVEDWASLCVAAEQYQCASDVRSQIWDWASKRDLAIDWFLDAAYLLLCVAGPNDSCPWSYPGSGFMELPGGVRIGGPKGSQLRKLRSTTPLPVLCTFNPAVQDRGEYLLGMRERMRMYCDAVETEFTKAGFEPTRRKRQRSGHQWTHVEWFVRNRLELRTQAQIAKKYNVAEDVVSKAVRQVADLLGFPKKARIRHLGTGDQALVATVGGAQTQSGVVISLQ